MERKGLPVMSISNISSTQSQLLSGLAGSPRARHKKEPDASTAATFAVSTGSSYADANSLAPAMAAALTQLGLIAIPGTASTATSTTAVEAAPATDASFRSAATTDDASSTVNALKALQAFIAQLSAAAQQAADADTASSSTIGGNAWAADTHASSAATTSTVATPTGAAATSSMPLAALPRSPSGSQQIQQYRDIASPFSNLAQALRSSSVGTSPMSSGASGLTSVFQNLWTSLSASSTPPIHSPGSATPSLQTFMQTLARNFSESGISGLRGVFVDTVI